jgi:6-phosphogluconolactonase
MAKDNLLDHVPVPSSNIFRIRGESDPAAEAVRYGEIFSRNVPPFQGIPQAGLLMLGLGEDGHTASIFPENIDLFNSDKLFEPSVHPVTKQKRITATGRIINRAKLVVIMATGESKALRIAQIINRMNGWERLPASLVNPEHGELIWLLDKKSSEGLK